MARVEPRDDGAEWVCTVGYHLGSAARTRQAPNQDTAKRWAEGWLARDRGHVLAELAGSRRP